jgi:metal-sulfur cluster biosynthetic enzyme
VNVTTNDTEKCVVAILSLQQVIDPEIDLNVVDMGLIYELTFDESTKKIFGLMTLSSRFCPMGHSIVDAVTKKLSVTFPEFSVLVNVTFDPPWNLEMITEEGRKFLTG